MLENNFTFTKDLVLVELDAKNNMDAIEKIGNICMKKLSKEKLY